MPKKKGLKKSSNDNFTIHDHANAPKPVTRGKKSMLPDVEPPGDVSWDQIDEDVDILEEVDEDGNKQIVYRKKKSNSKTENDNISERPGLIYPEIIWYLISSYIKPEDVGRFAGINKDCYGVTQRESFWRSLYGQYCQNNLKLPYRLRLENSFKHYGLRQRVIRALYHTYDVFIKKAALHLEHECQPHKLVKRVCVNMWYAKGPLYWSVFFKLKRLYPSGKSGTRIGLDFIEELGRIDANPEEDCQVLQVSCKSMSEVPPLMGMTLSSVNMALAHGFRHHRLRLGFHTGRYNVSRDVLPEHTVVLDPVVSVFVYDWWHPKYPYFDNKIPTNMRDDESMPVLKKDFFSIKDGEI